MKRILLFYILFCAFVGVGFAQTITVDKDVICAGENSYIGTDTNLNYVHIGDILCFLDDDTANYIIVHPDAWPQYADAGYTPLSVVFYVDQTGKHGWAVGMPIYFYDDLGEVDIYYYNQNIWASSDDNLDCLWDYVIDERDVLRDLQGMNNTLCISGFQSCYEEEEYGERVCLYPVVDGVLSPFYVPAMGQLNMLFAHVYKINEIVETIIGQPVETAMYDAFGWWSSTENDGENVFYMDPQGIVHIGPKSGDNLGEDGVLMILPIMDF